jgi:hypothetical protein
VKASLNKTRKTALICAVALLALSLGGIYAVSAQNEDDSASVNDEKGCFFALRWRGMPFGRIMGSLTEEQRNEIRDMISSKLEEWGITPPEPLLNEEQRDELRTGIEQLKEEGASREKIREFIAGKMEEYGIDPLKPRLTEKQRMELQQMREEGASKDEIKKKLEEWGINFPRLNRRNLAQAHRFKDGCFGEPNGN